MILSDEKISHLSHVILSHLKSNKNARLTGDEVQALKLIKKVLASELTQEEEVGRLARARLASYSRSIPEGSQEWEVLYRKFVEEETRKRIKS